MTKPILKMKLILKPLALIFMITAITSCSNGVKEDKQADANTSKFKGKIALDIRDSESGQNGRRFSVGVAWHAVLV